MWGALPQGKGAGFGGRRGGDDEARAANTAREKAK